MKVRALFVVSSLVFTAGCHGDTKAFLGVWQSSEDRTFDYAGTVRTEHFTSTVEITEGVSSDIVITDSRGCSFDATVNGTEATLHEKNCVETETVSPGQSEDVALHLQTGTATLQGKTIQLSYEGTLSTTIKGRTYDIGMRSEGKLTDPAQ